MKETLAFLMDPHSLRKIVLINPVFKMTPVIVKHLLQAKSIWHLEVYSKGKDYLSEIIRKMIKENIVEHFYKTIWVEFQMPIHDQVFSNATVL
mmetsp:Transcript_11291/g.12768  ORF Transcript_11291/g.12768 Transcript_11291/m.12768 type:complete len:93 (-) Transcript_11291:42-320(-)